MVVSNNGKSNTSISRYISNNNSKAIETTSSGLGHQSKFCIASHSLSIFNKACFFWGGGGGEATQKTQRIDVWHQTTLSNFLKYFELLFQTTLLTVYLFKLRSTTFSNFLNYFELSFQTTFFANYFFKLLAQTFSTTLNCFYKLLFSANYLFKLLFQTFSATLNYFFQLTFVAKKIVWKTSLNSLKK